MHNGLLRLSLTLLVLAFPTAVLVAGADTRPARPNILFILTDDHRFDVLGCAGHPIVKTPRIDALAAKGVYFSNAFVTTSICAASRASLLTALHERTHRYTFGEPPLRPEHVAVTYPVLLRRAGYRTGCFGKFGVGVGRGVPAQMFDAFADLNRTPYFKKQPDGTLRHVDEIIGDRATAFLRECKTGQPFCLTVGFNMAHGEDNDRENFYPPPPATAELYRDTEIPRPRLDDPKVFANLPEFLRTSEGRRRYFWTCDTPEKYQKNVRDYFRMVSGIDHIVGRVLAELERLGLDRNTVVIFTGDNGYLLGNRGLTGKWCHFEDSLRVPLIVYDPRLPASRGGRREEALALNIDIPATIVDLAGLPHPALHQGRSLAPLLRGEAVKDWRTDFFCEHLMNHAHIPKWEGVHDRRWVYARYFEQQPVYEFLHDLRADPDQLRNLAGDQRHAAQLERMRQRCDELRDSYGGVYRPQPGAIQKGKK